MKSSSERAGGAEQKMNDMMTNVGKMEWNDAVTVEWGNRRDEKNNNNKKYHHKPNTYT